MAISNQMPYHNKKEDVGSMMPLVYILLIAFALFSVFSSNLKRAIIGSGVFSLWVSFAYVLYRAPDVAIAEAVISSALTTVLFIITMKNYNDASASVRPRIMSRLGQFYYVFAFLAVVLVLYLTHVTDAMALTPLTALVMDSFFENGRIFNPVGNIYLNYRIFDTIFEALMLLISGLGVVHLIKYPGSMSSKKQSAVQQSQDGDPWHEMPDFGRASQHYHYHQEKTQHPNLGAGPLEPVQDSKSITLKNKRHPSAVLTITFIMPILFVIGVYLIISNPIAPGGGFQGGALLAGVFVSHYLLMPDHPVSTRFLESFEKLIFLMFVAIAILYVLMGLYTRFPQMYEIYFASVNLLLGIKVFCGLSIMFIYFSREHNKVLYANAQNSELGAQNAVKE